MTSEIRVNKLQNRPLDTLKSMIYNKVNIYFSNGN